MALLPTKTLFGVLLFMVELVALSLSCSPPTGDVRELTKAESSHFADSILVGKIQKTYVDGRFDYGGGSEAYTALMKVYCIYKGPISARLVNITEVGNIPGKCHSTTLEVGKEYIVFISSENAIVDVEIPNTATNRQNISRACGLHLSYPPGVTPEVLSHRCPQPAREGSCVAMPTEHNVNKTHHHEHHPEGHDHEGHESHEGHDHEGHDHESHEGHDHEGHEHDHESHEGHDHEGHDHEGHDHEGHDHGSHEGHEHEDHDHHHDHERHEGHDHEGHDHEGHDHGSHEGHEHEDHDHHHDHESHEGHDHEGHDHEGHDHEGHDHEGHDHEGHDHEGHDHEGHDHEGHQDNRGPHDHHQSEGNQHEGHHDEHSMGESHTAHGSSSSILPPNLALFLLSLAVLQLF